MKKVIGVIALLAVVGLGVYVYMQYEESQEEEHGRFIKPRLEYGTFVLYHISPGLAKANLHLLVDNPMPIGLAIDSFSYDFYIEDKKVFTSTYPDELELGAGDSSHMSIPVSIFLDSLERVRKQEGPPGREVDSVVYTIDADFYTRIPLLEDEKFNITHDFKAPLIRSPDVSIKAWSFEGMEDGDALVNLDLEIINYNMNKLHFKDIDYQLMLGEDERVVSGSKPGEVKIGKRDTAYVNLPVRLDFGDAAGATWDFITEGNDLRYRFEATLRQVSQSDMTDDSELTIIATGELEGLTDVVF